MAVVEERLERPAHRSRQPGARGARDHDQEQQLRQYRQLEELELGDEEHRHQLGEDEGEGAERRDDGQHTHQEGSVVQARPQGRHGQRPAAQHRERAEADERVRVEREEQVVVRQPELGQHVEERRQPFGVDGRCRELLVEDRPERRRRPEHEQPGERDEAADGERPPLLADDVDEAEQDEQPGHLEPYERLDPARHPEQHGGEDVAGAEEVVRRPEGEAPGERARHEHAVDQLVAAQRPHRGQHEREHDGGGGGQSVGGEVARERVDRARHEQPRGDVQQEHGEPHRQEQREGMQQPDEERPHAEVGHLDLDEPVLREDARVHPVHQERDDLVLVAGAVVVAEAEEVEQQRGCRYEERRTARLRGGGGVSGRGGRFHAVRSS